MNEEGKLEPAPGLAPGLQTGNPVGPATYDLGGSVAVQPWLGDIVQTRAAVIVSSIGSRASFRGRVNASILAAAGEEIKAEVQRYGLVRPGSVVVTGAGRLTGTRYLFHAVVTAAVEKGNQQYQARPKLIAEVAECCVRLADLLQQPSIAIPPLGSGLGRARPEDVVKVMIDRVADVFPECTHLKRVIFATTNPETYLLFNTRVLAVAALLHREEELKRALPALPPSLYGLVGNLLERMESARRAGTDRAELETEARAIISLGQELRNRLSGRNENVAQAVQLIINTGNNIVQNVTQIGGSVHGPVLSGTFEGPTNVGYEDIAR